MQNESFQADVIIVGGGLSGIVAALELLQNGKKVLLIDRDKSENFGGLAKWALGGMFFVDSQHQRKAGIKDSTALAIQDWFSFAQFDQEEHWGKNWAEQYIHLATTHGYEWLRKYQIKFLPVINWVERGLYQPGNSVPRFHIVWGTGWGLVQTLIGQLKQQATDRNLQLLFEHRVLEIITTQGNVVGVRGATTTGGDFEYYADIVIVATGGINGSIEKIKANWHNHFGTPPATILNGAHPFAVGDLHNATSNINGNVVNLNKQWNYAAGIRHYAPRYPNHGLSLVPCKSALWLNYQGKRFHSMPLVAGYDTRYLVERICQEPVQYSWQVLNQVIAKKEFAISGSEHNELIRDKKFLPFLLQTLMRGSKDLVQKIVTQCEDVVVAYSLEELAEKMNLLTGEDHVEVAHLKASILPYDAQIQRGTAFYNDEQLRRIAHARQYRGDRMRTCNFQQILDPKAMPLIGIRAFILSRKSLGGIQTNLQSQVLAAPDTQGQQQIIPGLYAIGEAAGFGGGGIHGYRSLEGTFLGGCVITARVAVASICNQQLA
jgi:predicted oxidoreductase